MAALESVPPGPTPSDDDNTVGSDALSRLVRDVQKSGASFQQMATRAQARGHEISKPYFQKLAAGNATTAPDSKRLLAIAAGLQVPPNVVKRAAALQFLDYRATELAGYDDELRIIVAHLAGKSRPELRRWRAMIEAEDRLSDDD